MRIRTTMAMLSVSVILIIAALPVSAETAGDLQREERGIFVTDSYSQTSELTTLKDEIILKRNEIQTFKKNILSRIQWNIPPDIMTLSANGRLEGDSFLFFGGDIEGEFNAEASARSEKLYKGIDPYVSEETAKDMLLFARNLLEENGTYSPAEQVLEMQLKELENKEINESGGMHIFYIQKLYNSVVDIGNELDTSVGSIGNKMQTEYKNEDQRNFDNLSIFGKIIHLWKFCLVLLFVIMIFVWWVLSIPGREKRAAEEAESCKKRDEESSGYNREKAKREKREEEREEERMAEKAEFWKKRDEESCYIETT